MVAAFKFKNWQSGEMWLDLNRRKKRVMPMFVKLNRPIIELIEKLKIISDEKTDEVLGVHMIAPRAADLIMEGVIAMEYRASAEDIARISHPHPTYSEAVKEAALSATDSRPLHI